MTAIMATNRGEADYTWAMPHDGVSVADMTVSEVPAWLTHPDALVVDVREPHEYAAGHLPGAVSIPQAELALQVSTLPRDRDLLVVCEGGTRSVRAARFLKQVGFAHVTNLAGGTAAWRAAGQPTEK
jgi:rhodanese-related sulfurtransferase